jgi:peptide/nickel transport system substrate-binding protein
MRKSYFYLALSLILVLVILVSVMACSSTTTTTATATTTATTTTSATTTTTTTAATTTSATVTTTATATATATGTATATSTTATPQKGGVLQLMYHRLPTSSVGWPATVLPQDTGFMGPCVQTLVTQAHDLSIQPLLATSWDIPEDKLSITFHIRKGVKFHDGSDLNAEVVKFNLDNVMAAKHAGTNLWTSVSVIDDYTVKIKLTAWQNTMLARFASRTGQIVSKVSVEKNGVEWAKNNPVSTGPFTFVSLQRDTSLEFKKFNNYWDTGKPYLDGIKWTQVKDPMTQIAAFTNHEVNVLSSTDAKTLSDASKVSGATLSFEYDGSVVIYPDARNADSPLSNKLVRQAIDYAINKDEIIAIAGYGIFGAAHQLGFPNSPGFIQSLETARTFNPTKAKELMKQAGFEKGFTITLAIQNATYKDTQVAVQKYLADIGITCKLELWNNAQYDEKQVKGWTNTGILSPGAGRNLATAMESYFLTPNYYVSLKGPDNLQALVNAAFSTVTLETPKVEAIAQAVFDDVSMIPVNYMGAGRVYYKSELHDTGYLNYASFMEWDPANAWLSK